MVQQTDQPYEYAGDDPVNESDPTGESQLQIETEPQLLQLQQFFDEPEPMSCPVNDPGEAPDPSVKLSYPRLEGDRAFAHGTSAYYATNIAQFGLNESNARAASRGGRGSPGSFFTFELSTTQSNTALQLAYEFGLLQDPNPDILLLYLPDDVANNLESTQTNGAGHTWLWTRPVPGAELPESIFDPVSYPTVNEFAQWFIITP